MCCCGVLSDERSSGLLTVHILIHHRLPALTQGAKHRGIVQRERWQREGGVAQRMGLQVVQYIWERKVGCEGGDVGRDRVGWRKEWAYR